MAEARTESVGQNLDELCRLADEYWAQDLPQAALEAAWAAFDLAPDRHVTKELLAKLLRDYPDALQHDRRAVYLKLLTDPEVEPNFICTAGWRLVLSRHRLVEDTSDAIEAIITDLEHDELVLTLLREAPVCSAAAERLLTRLRRWLLVAGRWPYHAEIVAALKVQTSLNGGAWPFDEFERALLAEPECIPMIPAYFLARAPRANPAAAEATDPVTRAVASQYEAWPYPSWSRITVGEEKRLPDLIREMDPEASRAVPVEANMLIAGCGTGREAAIVASRYPDVTVTAIDLSEASLEYARRRCALLGIDNVRFLNLDLHDVARLNQKFHAISCGGVLHHLSNPERGLNLLADVLQPGGVMRIMVYSRFDRLRIVAARTLIEDLVYQSVNDDLLRQVRQRFLQRSQHPLADSILCSWDFATLAGTHDMLLHRHDDPFDIARLEYALDRLGLRLLSFQLPTRAAAARYGAMFPDDTRHQDIKSWARFERSEIGGNYEFWCCSKPQRLC